MEYSEHELALMKSLATEEMLQLLKKIFVDMPSANLSSLDKNIVALSDEQYGQLMKVKYLTQKDNESRIDFIKKTTKERPTSKSTNAPR